MSGQNFWMLYVFYWVKVSLNLRFAVSIIDLFITIQYAVFLQSLSTLYLSLSIYIYIYMYVCILYLFVIIHLNVAYLIIYNQEEN